MKEHIFELLDNALHNESLIVFGTNKEIAEDMRYCTDDIDDLPGDIICQYIQEWKDKRLSTHN